MFHNFFFPRKLFRLCDNVEEYGTTRQGTDSNIIRRMRIGCLVTTAVTRHTQYVILIAFPLQQWLYERVSLLRYTYIAGLVWCLLF